jgi:hypothetical protein
MLVFWILGPLFAALGLYLLWYSRRRRRMLEAFAGKHRLRIQPGYREKLQETLDGAFSLEGEGLVRSLSQLSSIVDGGSVRIFRTIELLDLNPYAQSYTTHYNRIAALFEIPAGHDEFFLLDKSMQASRMLPGAGTPAPEVVDLARRAAVSCSARHPLSVTLARGHGLIYFEPLVVGGESLGDVDSLYCIAKQLHDALLVETGVGVGP